MSARLRVGVPRIAPQARTTKVTFRKLRAPNRAFVSSVPCISVSRAQFFEKYPSQKLAARIEKR